MNGVEAFKAGISNGKRHVARILRAMCRSGWMTANPDVTRKWGYVRVGDVHVIQKSREKHEARGALRRARIAWIRILHCAQVPLGWWIVQLPVFFQTVFRTTATVSGLLLIPLTLAQVVVSTATGLRTSSTGHPRTSMAAGLSIVATAFFVLAAGIKFGPSFIALLTLVIGAGLGSTMPAAQTMVQWAAGKERLGIGTATVSFSRSLGGAMGAAIVSAVLLGALQVVDPNARTLLSRELSSIGSSHVEPSQIAPALMAAYRWVFFVLGGLSGCAALVAWSIPNLDLAGSPTSPLATSSFRR